MPTAKKKPAGQAFKKLQTSLKKLSKSPRYSEIKELELSSLLREEKSFGLLDELKIEKILALSLEKSSKLNSLRSSELTRLTKLFDSLGKKNIPSVSDAEPQHLGSVEAEIKLKEAIREIKSDSRYKILSQKTLGDFWNKNGIRAPFEEAFTIKQLSEFDLSILLRKRGMNSTKISLMIQALEKALLV